MVDRKAFLQKAKDSLLKSGDLDNLKKSEFRPQMPNFPLFRVRKETHYYGRGTPKSAWIVESVLGFEADGGFCAQMARIYGRKEKALRGYVFFSEADANAQCADLNKDPHRFEKELYELEKYIKSAKQFSKNFKL